MRELPRHEVPQFALEHRLATNARELIEFEARHEPSLSIAFLAVDEALPEVIIGRDEAIDRIAPLGTKPGRYRPSDALLAFLEGL